MADEFQKYSVHSGEKIAFSTPSEKVSSEATGIYLSTGLAVVIGATITYMNTEPGTEIATDGHLTASVDEKTSILNLNYLSTRQNFKVRCKCEFDSTGLALGTYEVKVAVKCTETVTEISLGTTHRRVQEKTLEYFYQFDVYEPVSSDWPALTGECSVLRGKKETFSMPSEVIVSEGAVTDSATSLMVLTKVTNKHLTVSVDKDNSILRSIRYDTAHNAHLSFQVKCKCVFDSAGLNVGIYDVGVTVKCAEIVSGSSQPDDVGNGRQEKTLNYAYRFYVYEPFPQEWATLTMYRSKDDYALPYRIPLPPISAMSMAYKSTLSLVPTLIYGARNRFAMDLGTTKTISLQFTRTAPPSEDAVCGENVPASGLTAIDNYRTLSAGGWSAIPWAQLNHGDYFNLLMDFVDTWQNLTYVPRDEENVTGPDDMVQSGGMILDIPWPDDTENKLVHRNVFLTGSIQPRIEGNSAKFTLKFAVARMQTTALLKDGAMVTVTLKSGTLRNTESYEVKRTYPIGAKIKYPTCPFEWQQIQQNAAYNENGDPGIFARWDAKWVDKDGNDLTDEELAKKKKFSENTPLLDNLVLEAKWTKTYVAYVVDKPGDEFGMNFVETMGLTEGETYDITCILVGGGGGGGRARDHHKSPGLSPNPNVVGGGGGQAGGVTYVIHSVKITQTTWVKIKIGAGGRGGRYRKDTNGGLQYDDPGVAGGDSTLTFVEENVTYVASGGARGASTNGESYKDPIETKGDADEYNGGKAGGKGGDPTGGFNSNGNPGEAAEQINGGTGTAGDGGRKWSHKTGFWPAEVEQFVSGGGGGGASALNYAIKETPYTSRGGNGGDWGHADGRGGNGSYGGGGGGGAWPSNWKDTSLSAGKGGDGLLIMFAVIQEKE